MKSIKRMVSGRRRTSSYFKVSTRGSPTTSRSPSPATSTNANNTASSTAATGTSSDEEIDVRSKLEKELFDLVNSRQAQNVQEFLKKNRNININVVDLENLTLLHHAVLNNDPEMVDVILKDNFEIDVHDVLLRAIKDNLMPMVMKLMKWKATMQSKSNKIATTLFTRYKHYVDGTEYYDNYITPLLMAAIHGHYELLNYLYERGERLPDQHIIETYRWKPWNKDGAIPAADLKVSANRADLFKGLSNPAYIAFMAGADKTYDPILASFKLAKTIKQWIEIEPEFKDTYEEILKKLEKFPVALLNYCRDSEETSILLKKNEDSSSNAASSYPRLLLAIDYKQKAFVASTNAQDVLYQEWIGEPWITTGWGPYLGKRFLIFLSTILFPIISIFLIFTMCCLKNTKIVKYITSPKRRCMNSCVSYFYFFVVVYVMNTTGKPIGYLGPPSHYLPWLVGIFVLSHFVAFLKHVVISPEHFIKQGWNIYDLVSHLFWFITFGLWVALWKRGGTLGTITIHNVTLTSERMWLDSNDLLLWSEIMTGFASTIGGLKLLRYALISPVVGPLQIALGKMKNEIFQFSIIFGIIVVSFALGFQHLYRPYNAYHTEPCAFCDFSSSVESLVYSLFTMTASDSSKVPATNYTMEQVVNGTKMNVTLPNHHLITEAAGTILFIALHIISITFLMNMLTGIMSSTYEHIKGNVNVEWRYARAQLWLYYIQDSILTPPFNIYPDCLMLCNCFPWGKAMLSARTRKRACCNFTQFCYVADEEDDKSRKERQRQYPLLIRRLLQRYFRTLHSTTSDDPPAEKDVAVVRKQIIELRALTTTTLELHSNPNSGSKINVQKANPPTTAPSVPNIV